MKKINEKFFKEIQDAIKKFTENEEERLLLEWQFYLELIGNAFEKINEIKSKTKSPLKDYLKECE